MNIPDLGEILELEVLSKPEVANATLFKIQSKDRICLNGHCCPNGRIIPCNAIFPHEKGLIVKCGSNFLLNNTEIISEVTAPLEEIPNNHSTVLNWEIPQRIVRAYKHPWGAIMIEEENPKGVAVSLLVLPH